MLFHPNFTVTSAFLCRFIISYSCVMDLFMLTEGGLRAFCVLFHFDGFKSLIIFSF